MYAEAQQPCYTLSPDKSTYQLVFLVRWSSQERIAEVQRDDIGVYIYRV